MKTNKQRAQDYRERKKKGKKVNINVWISKFLYLKLVYFAKKKEVNLNQAIEKLINKEKGIIYSQMLSYFENLPKEEREKYLG